MNYETVRQRGHASLIQPYPRRLIKICTAGLLTFNRSHSKQLFHSCATAPDSHRIPYHSRSYRDTVTILKERDKCKGIAFENKMDVKKECFSAGIISKLNCPVFQSNSFYPFKMVGVICYQRKIMSY